MARVSQSSTAGPQNKPENLAALADELVALKVDLIAAVGTIAVNAAKNATKTIPIVMIGVADAVASGFVASLAQPGGNITGTTNIMPELAGKRLGLLRELLPKLSRVAFLAYGPDPAHRLFDEGSTRTLPRVSRYGFSRWC